jgi:16S rRNA (cytidine1402-2'-O)-methyltransferase
MPAGTLFVVATPLGNLSDLSARAISTLRQVGTVAAEDTRRTQALLSAIDAHTKLLSYHAHSGSRRIDAIVALLVEGRDVALVTDAGTPGISDPGVEVVAAARAAGVTVVPIPGPSAVATALSASGIACDRFVFIGFVPRKGSERRDVLERMAREPWALVLYEAANRLPDLLADLAQWCGATRNAVVGRELTKIHEEFRGGTLSALQTYYETTAAIGEVTLVVAGLPADQANAEALDLEQVAAVIAEALQAGQSRKDVIRMVSARFGVARNVAYRLVTDHP